MRRLKNQGCVYTGLVGKQMPLVHRIRRGRRVSWMKVKCFGGPLQGKVIQVDKFGDGTTITFKIGSHVGQYRAGKWLPDERVKS